VTITPAHQAKIDEWEARFGGAEITAESNYPLTPGTEPAGTRECFKCGTKRPTPHQSRECPNLRVSAKEQDYRFKVSEKKRLAGQQQNYGQGQPGRQFGGYNQRYGQGQGFASGSNSVPIPPRGIMVGALEFEEDREGLEWMGLNDQGQDF
jgi:hypothetical protein